MFIAAGGIATVFAFQVSAVGIFRAAAPEKALRLVPADAQARANLAARIAEYGESPAAMERARTLALDAIRRDPLQVTAFRVLASIEERIRADEVRVRRLIDYAERLSRRDQFTQIWLIQDAVRRGRADQAIHHFDIAIRSTARGRDTLFTLLVGATADRRLLPPLRRLLVQKPDWWLPFVTRLAGSGPDSTNAAALIRGLLDPTEPDERRALQILIGRLSEEGEYDLAWSVYRETSGAAGPRRDASTVRGGTFDTASLYPPFEWWYSQEPNLWAARELTGSSGSIVRLFSQNGAAGDALRQLVALAPGRYRLQATTGGIPADQFNRPTIAVACADRAEPRQLAGAKPVAGQSAHPFAMDFTVPSGCRWQWIKVELSGESRDPETAPWLDDLSVRRQP